MGCVNPDGTLTETARAMIRALEKPATPEELAVRVDQPVFLVRSGLRQLSAAGFVRVQGEQYQATDSGRARL